MSPSVPEESWTFVCASSELLPGELKTVWDELTDTPIIVFNQDGDFYALEDRCSHGDYELSPGDYDAVTGTIGCLLHGARFDIRDGRPLCAPAYTPVIKFPVRLQHGGVWTRDDR